MAKKSLALLVPLFMTISTATAQVADDADGLFDSTSYVETDSTTTSNSTVTSTNTNTNNTTIDSTNTNVNTTTLDSTTTSTNTNVNTNTSTIDSTSTNTNTNVNTNTSTIDSTSTNTNTNINTSTSTIDSTTNSTVNSTSNNTNTNTNVNTSTIDQTIMPGGNDTCTVTFSGAVQSQLIGISGGGHIRDLNCERLKNAKTLYNMGMKVAAVSLMCQNESIYRAMEMAGTPCPFKGSIGDDAQALWDENPQMKPTEIEQETRRNDKLEGAAIGGILMAILLAL
jgi:hypothetical protein